MTMTIRPGLVRTEVRAEQKTVRRGWVRLLAVAAAMAGALLGWTLITQVAGVDLRAPDFGGSGGTAAVGLAQVVLVTGLAGLAAWGLLALLERRTHGARRLWLGLAMLGFLLSLGGPLSGDGVTSADRGLLIALHAAVAVVLIPLLALSSRPGRRAATRVRDELTGASPTAWTRSVDPTQQSRTEGQVAA
jgi:Family of unknown function (DUF6069)